jgi:hypothetical protein
MEFPDDENGDVLRRMLADGDNLSVSRDIDFLVVLPDEGAAQRFVEVISSRFDRVRYSEMETSRPLKWDVTATLDMIPDHQVITAIEAFLANAAEPFGGKNDGWGCFRQ